MALQEDSKNPSFEQRFGWYVVINRLTKDDITRHEQVLQKTLVEILNQLTYLIEKDKEMIKQQKQQLSKI